MRSFALFLFAGALFAQRPAGKPGTVNFQREIRPILSDNCFACHGPDKNTRLANLRLDVREAAFEKRANGSAPIVPGNPQASLIYQRIMHEKPGLRMPPLASHKVLSAQQKETLKRWIEQGAPWTEHWSFIAPVRTPLPAVKQSSWVRNPIDRFVLAKLEAAGLKPAPEADRRTLARRVALDTTGLPPEPADVEEFVRDKSPEAYDRYIEKMMSSSRWGEHRGRYWLDAARYADTHGIHVDNYREMWAYRDWVINAFNKNVPFDRFTIEQVAGDLLPNRTMDQQIASGFHRCNVTTNEAGLIEAEYEAIYAKDRVDTTGAVFLGLTIGCATCHDHKFDPLSQKDFYSMTAFFRNTTQKVMDGNVPDTPPILIIPEPSDRARWASLRVEQADLRKEMGASRAGATEAFNQWVGSSQRSQVGAPLNPQDEVFALDPAAVKLPEGARLGEADAASRKAIHLGPKTAVELPNQPVFESGKPFSIAVSFLFPKGEDAFSVASQSDPKKKNHGWGISVEARVAVLRLTGDDGKQITMRAAHLEQLKPGTWNHLIFTYDGSREQAGLAMYQNGIAIPTQGAGDQNLELPGEIKTTMPLQLGHEGTRYLAGGAVADLRIFNRVLTEEEARMVARWPVIKEALAKPAGELTKEDRDALNLYHLVKLDPDYQRQSARSMSLAAEARGIRKRGSVTHVMEERADSKPMAHILYRGMYDQPRDEVQPAVPAALPPLPASYPRNRLGLAQWLVDSSNPLTARVTMNRFWQEVFGTGLVKTAEDFGSQGEAPSHPELLDWLALEFRDNGWDVKKMFKLMLTSATYRQAALTSADKLKADPENRLLSRGPRFRMDAELVRDYALAVSGLLSPRIGGPSVKPYQPEGVWEAVAMIGSNTRFYKPDHGDKLYRRSMYWFWKRSAPPASMELFNAPTREACTVRRERTNTPLQALVTMNDTQFVEAARALAERTMEQVPGPFDKQLDELSARLISRPFNPKERAVVNKAYADYLRYYDSHPDDAKKLVNVGESKPKTEAQPVNLAAMTMVINQLLNLDEVLNK